MKRESQPLERQTYQHSQQNQARSNRGHNQGNIGDPVQQPDQTAANSLAGDTWRAGIRIRVIGNSQGQGVQQGTASRGGAARAGLVPGTTTSARGGNG